MNHPTDTPSVFTAVPGHTRLFRREGGTYYLRAKVPAALRPIVGKTEIRKSLRTKTLKEALPLVKIESLRVDREFSEAEAKAKGKSAPDRKMSREELAWIVADFVVKSDHDSVVWTEKAREELSDSELRDIADDLATDAEAYDSFSKSSHSLETSDGAGFLDEYLRNEGARWEIVPGSDDYKYLLREIRRAKVEVLNRSIDRLHGKRVVKRDFQEYDANSRATPTPRQNISLGKLLDVFMENKKLNSTETGLSAYKVPERALRQILGEKTPLASISKHDVEKVFEVLLKTPVNMAQRYPGLSFERAIAEADRRADKRRLSQRSLVNYHIKIVAIFNYACGEEYISSNPAKSRKLRELFKQKKKPAQRPLFTDAELTAIFRAPLYKGCVDDMRNYAKAGPNRPKRGRFWTPLLALFHGFRCNEACQLYVADVGEEGGIPFLNVREELDDDEQTEKRIKNSASWRKVPIHPEVIKMGFLNYVEERKGDSASPRLFPTLRLSKNTGRYSHVFSKWFGQFLVSACGHKPKGSFHSFRHGFATKLVGAGVSDTIAKKLGGWTPSGIMNTEYVHGELPTLHAAISKLSYPNLDLSHLYISEPRMSV